MWVNSVWKINVSLAVMQSISLGIDQGKFFKRMGHIVYIRENIKSGGLFILGVMVEIFL